MTAPALVHPTQPRIGDRWRSIAKADVTVVVKDISRGWDGTVKRVLVSIDGSREWMLATELRAAYRLNRRA